ncbi:MAG: ATP-binding protein [Terracidiphilus sp.]|jgi:signal transduction histidine kinase
MQQRTARTPELKETGVAAAILIESGVDEIGLADGRGAETERRRVEAVVETLANLRSDGESLAEVAHDARNMVTALGLYCDLLAEPGVLSASYTHYASELRLVATASRRLVEKLLALDLRIAPLEGSSRPAGSSQAASSLNVPVAEALGLRHVEPARHWDLMPPEPIINLAAELLANRNLLAALAGPRIALTVDAEGGARPVRITGEDLTRILVNLVKNAAEAMHEGGRIQLGLRELPADPAGQKLDLAPSLLLTVEDNGPGIPKKSLQKIFDSGFTTHAHNSAASGSSRQAGETGWTASHRGLGLSITRSIIEAAGGQIRAANRSLAGARFEIQLPIGSR